MVLQIRCGTTERRLKVKDSPTVNGIDYLEIYTSKANSDSAFKMLIIVFFLKSSGLADIKENNISISGGTRIKDVRPDWASTAKNVIDDLNNNVSNNITEDISTDERNIIDGILDPEKVFLIRPNVGGDFSTYTLQFISDPLILSPLENFDIILSTIDFSFKVGCPVDFDCRSEVGCYSKAKIEPVIDYMAKDFASFRRLMLDHFSSIIPQWTERNPSDVGIASLELIAYVADHLSYYQDAVSTECYLGTARKRESVKRHARLLDYFMHDGCNARTFVFLELGPIQQLELKKGTKLLTRASRFSSFETIVPLDKIEEEIKNDSEPFETMHDITLYKSHNEISFYSWGESQCCLPRGGTSATILNDGNKFDLEMLVLEELTNDPSNLQIISKLVNYLSDEFEIDWVTDPSLQVIITSDKSFEITDGTNHLFVIINNDRTSATISNKKDAGQIVCELYCKANGAGQTVLFIHSLKQGDLLIIEEVCSPTTYQSADADPTHRHAVRLLKVIPTSDPLFDSIPLLEISWNIEDALPFPVCIEVMKKDEGGNTVSLPISVARGNIVIADHGYTEINQINSSTNPPPVTEEGDIITVDETNQIISATEFLAYVIDFDSERTIFRPSLSRRPLTFKVPLIQSLSASESLKCDPRYALPEIELYDGEGRTWLPLRDLLKTDDADNHFVVEVDNDGKAFIRFKNLAFKNDSITNGSNKPLPFYAKYRVGNGIRGNVAQESISRIVSDAINNVELINKVRNPVAAVNGMEPEQIDDVRQYAPYAFRSQRRAVKEEDYITALNSHPEIQSSAASFGWTGSWYTVFISIDRIANRRIDNEFKESIYKLLDQYRLVGYDLEIKEAVRVPIYIKLSVCTKPGYFSEKIKQRLLEVFSNRTIQDGTRGLFHPDNWRIGQILYSSKIYQAAMAISGVESCNMELFHRWRGKPKGELESGFINLAKNEVIQLDNDPNFPENGKIVFIINGQETP